MNSEIIAQARIFMGGEARRAGDEICTSCGRPLASAAVKKAMSAAFNQTGFLLFRTMHVCPACLALFGDKDGRSKILLYRAPGQKKLLDRQEVLPLLADPPRESFVLSVPYSFKKHHWMSAGLSCAKSVFVGTDDRTVALDYTAHDVPDAIAAVGEMLLAGVPRTEIPSGRYGVLTRARFGRALDEWEARIAPLRPCGGAALFVKYSPAAAGKKNAPPSVEKPMYTKEEEMAVRLLADIAAASQYRRENGLEFWKTFFKRRIVRYASMDLHEFVSSLAGSCGCSPQGLPVAPCGDLSPEDEEAVMDAVRREPDLLAAAAYTMLKSEKSAPVRRHSPDEEF